MIIDDAVDSFVEEEENDDYDESESLNAEHMDTAASPPPPPPLSIKTVRNEVSDKTSASRSPGRMTRRERRKLREQAKVEETQRKKEEIRKRATAEKKKEEKKRQTLAKKGKSFRKRQAKKRATVLFMQDPSMNGLLGKIRESEELDSINEMSDEEEGGIGLRRHHIATSTVANDRPGCSSSVAYLRATMKIMKLINDEQLHDALRALGFTPTDDLLKKYYFELAKQDESYKPKQRKRGGKRRHKVRMNLTTFLTASKFLDEAVDCSQEITPLFSYFDKSNGGKITVRQLKHFLRGVSAPTRLSSEEVDELFRSSPMLKDIGDDPDATIRYEELIESMVFA